MTEAIVWIILGIIFALLLVFIIVIRRKGNAQVDYRALFMLGAVFIPVGIATKNFFMWIFGLGLIVISLANYKRWKEQKTWKQLNKKQKKQRMWIMISLGIVVLVGLILFLIINFR